MGLKAVRFCARDTTTSARASAAHARQAGPPSDLKVIRLGQRPDDERLRQTLQAVVRKGRQDGPATLGADVQAQLQRQELCQWQLRHAQPHSTAASPYLGVDDVDGGYVQHVGARGHAMDDKGPIRLRPCIPPGHPVRAEDELDLGRARLLLCTGHAGALRLLFLAADRSALGLSHEETHLATAPCRAHQRSGLQMLSAKGLRGLPDRTEEAVDLCPSPQGTCQCCFTSAVNITSVKSLIACWYVEA